MSEIIKCKRCNRILTSKESIERGYGGKCFRIIQLQKNDMNRDQDIQFLKSEVKFLKRQLKELKQNNFVSNIDPIERIKQDQHRPERDQFKIEFNVVVKELKIIFQGENFNYHKILKPIESITEIEIPPEIELIN